MSLSRLRELVMDGQTWHAAEGWGYVHSLLFELRPNYYGGNEDNGDLLQKVSHMPWDTRCPLPHPAAGYFRPTPPPETPGHTQVWVSLSRGHCSFLLGAGVPKV